MRVALLFASIATLLNAPAVRSQNTNDIQFVIDAIFSLCVGGGGTVSVSASGNADDSFSLRKSDTAGRVREVTIDKSEAKGLVAGLNNAISSVAADQADKVRECIKPYRDRIMNMVLTTRGVSPATSKAPPAELDISGVWRDEWGLTSWITQQGSHSNIQPGGTAVEENSRRPAAEPLRAILWNTIIRPTMPRDAAREQSLLTRGG